MNIQYHGIYISVEAGVTNTLVNCPVKGGAFKIIVEYLHRSDRIKQTIYAHNNDSNTYVRIYSTDGWQNWKQIAMYDAEIEEWKTFNNIDGFSYRKIGNDVEISIIMDKANIELGNGDWHSMGNLPAGYRPKTKSVTNPIVMYYNNGLSLMTGQISIGTSGEIIFRQMLGQKVTLYGARGYIKYSIL